MLAARRPAASEARAPATQPLLGERLRRRDAGISQHAQPAAPVPRSEARSRASTGSPARARSRSRASRCGRAATRSGRASSHSRATDDGSQAMKRSSARRLAGESRVSHREQRCLRLDLARQVAEEVAGAPSWNRATLTKPVDDLADARPIARPGAMGDVAEDRSRVLHVVVQRAIDVRHRPGRQRQRPRSSDRGTESRACRGTAARGRATRGGRG